jgi:hypothetical protein
MTGTPIPSFVTQPPPVMVHGDQVTYTGQAAADVASLLASYTRILEKMGKTTKSVVIHHVDTAVLTQGDSQFGYDIKSVASQIAGQVANYDELMEVIPKHARRMWAEDIELRGLEISPAVGFFVGWSDRAGAFVAHAMASDDDFATRRVTDPRVMPMPWSLRLSDLGLERMMEAERDHPQLDKIVEMWRSKALPARPESLEDWHGLGFRIREERSLSTHFGRVIVAGELVHTRIQRGGSITQTIAEFNDEGEEFMQMIGYSQHPQAQVMPRWCDSGERFIDCHLAPHVDEPCGCGSGQTFRECCSVGAANA